MPRILIADDNSNIQKMVTLALHDAGIEVVSVSNGGAAIRSLTETPPDLVLADVFMPVRNGYEVCDFIKHDTRFSQVPVVLLVGAFDPLDESEAQRVSADGILKKPFIPPDPLINLVKTLLSKSFNERPETMPVRVAVHAGHERAPDEAGHAAVHTPEAPAAAAAMSEPVAEEPLPDAIEADFGSHEETLAFGSLLQMTAPAETADEPAAAIPLPATWDQGGVSTEIPELDDVVPPVSINKAPHAPAVDESSGAVTENAADLEAELGFQMPPDLGEELESELEEEPEEFESHTEFHPDVSSAANFDPVGDREAEELTQPAVTELNVTDLKPWENVAPSVRFEPPAMPESAGAVLEEEVASHDLAEGSEPDYAELAPPEVIEGQQAEPHSPAPETIHESSHEALPSMALPDWPPASWTQSSTEVLPAWPAAPIFPGSDKLWAAGSPTPSRVEESPAQVEKAEIAAPANVAESHEAETVPAVTADYERDHAADYGLAEIQLPPPEDVSEAEHSVDEAGIAKHVAELVPSEPLAEIAAAAVTADAKLEPHSEAQPAVRPATDPELIEAVVSRIVERMQPKVMDVVTREILRPLVEALVRREINRNS